MSAESDLTLSKISDVFTKMEYGPAPESAGIALDWIAAHNRVGLFINGVFVKPRQDQWFTTLNPASGEPLCEIATADGTDVNSAVAAARIAQPEWWNIGPHARSRYLYAMARQLQKHSRIFSVLETLENGKPIRETRDIDIPLVNRHFYHHAGWAQLLHDEFVGANPVGVIGQIIPWNFPLLMLSWKIAPALAAGNTVVLKPAEYSSLTALRFAELCQEIGLPPGVVNIVTGDGKTGEAIVSHPGVDKIAFTGSTEVGRIIRRTTAGTEKKISLELGGKSPFIVFDDADLDSAVEGVVDAIWFNQGQVCCAGSRLLVQENVAETFLRKLRHRMESLRVGDPLDKCTDIGAIIDQSQLEKITSLVNAGVQDGAELWQPQWSCPAHGFYYPPSLITNVSPASTIAQEEIFGPVLVSMTFRTPAEAVELANNTPYGLAASIWSEDINRALDIAPKIKAGTVWINSTNLFDAASGFGGYKESGYGREGGKEGMWEYLVPPKQPIETNTDREMYEPEDSYVSLPSIDKTAKLYVGGKQVRPDSGYSLTIPFATGGNYEVGDGNRKDIRNAVEAARGAQKSWAAGSAHLRAQIIYYLAENLESRSSEFAELIGRTTGYHGQTEVELAIDRIFTYAAMADKYDGRVHSTPLRNVTLAMNEPIGVMGIVCPNEFPLLGLLSAVMPAISMGNTVVAVPTSVAPIVATELYRVFETSDIPGGVINIVTGNPMGLLETLAGHDDVDAVWYFGGQEGRTLAQRLSAGNMKRTWTPKSEDIDWNRANTSEFLREATQVKNIWIPYGE